MILESLLFDGNDVADPDDLIGRVKGEILDVLYSQKTDVYVVIRKLTDEEEIRYKQEEVRQKILDARAKVQVASDEVRSHRLPLRATTTSPPRSEPPSLPKLFHFKHRRGARIV